MSGPWSDMSYGILWCTDEYRKWSDRYGTFRIVVPWGSPSRNGFLGQYILKYKLTYDNVYNKTTRLGLQKVIVTDVIKFFTSLEELLKYIEDNNITTYYIKEPNL